MIKHQVGNRGAAGSQVEREDNPDASTEDDGPPSGEEVVGLFANCGVKKRGVVDELGGGIHEGAGRAEERRDA